MSKDVLKEIVGKFDTDKFIKFFRDKNRSFAPKREELSQYDDESFRNSLKLGEINFADEGQNLIVCAIESSNSLTERSGKKAQYEKSKKILKELQADTGIFIFYSKNGNFRFSLIYANYLGTKRDWSTFRRFTYFVSPDFTNKTFLQRIGDGDFSSLEKIKDAFSVEKVTKDFYKDIANWYFWAVQKSKFPKDAETEKNGRNIAIIRLITRLIFIWFMRERGLVPSDLFQKQKINDYLKDFSSEKSTYYKAILQNLFFATLSTKQKERKFGSEKRFYKGWNRDYGVQYVFRYHDLFKKSDEIKNYFGDIPFLNGGLFECLDDKRNGIIIDGFSRTKKNQPIVPNFLFFSAEQDVNLNKEYGTKKKKYKVRGLIDTLSSYNFTIDENDPDDAEVALDPELLGKVFENLLASFNPETSSTARKATGSYYTPREIVSYMVTQSLKEYFKTHLKDVKELDKKINQLFENGDSQNPFTEGVSKKIVTLIDNLRIVDPAVGSGAFPMDILNKLVFVLGKLDPNNKFWKEAQIEAIKNSVSDPALRRKLVDQINDQFKNKNFDYGRKLYLIQKCIYGVDIQQIAVEIAKLRFFITLLVDEKIDKTQENWNIEPLPNLDFKIMQGNSLLEEFEGMKLFDEKFTAEPDFDKQKQSNCLKQKQLILQREYLNLHSEKKLTKIKQAELNYQLQKVNIQLKKLNQKEKDNSKDIGLFDAFSEAKKKFKEFKKLQKEFFTPEMSDKKEIKEKLDKLEWELIEATLREQGTTTALKKLEKYKKSKNKPFFLWKLNFSEVFERNGGFDVVIANPPYISSWNMGKKFKEFFVKNYNSATGHYDMYILFIERSFNLLRKNGLLTFITSNKFFSQKYGLGVRKILLENEIKEIVNFNFNVFETATVETCILIAKKNNNTSLGQIKILDIQKETENVFNIPRKLTPQLFFDESENKNFKINLTDTKVGVLDKIKDKTIALENICYIDCGIVVHSEKLRLKKNAFIYNVNKNNSFKKYIEGKNIKKNSILSKRETFLDYQPKNHHRPKFRELFENKKILIKDIGGKTKINCCIDTESFYTNDSIRICVRLCDLNNVKNKQIDQYLKDKDQNLSLDYDLRYLYALISSSVIRFYFFELICGGLHIYPNEIRLFPIKKTSQEEQKPLIEVVNKILVITKDKDYFQNPSKRAQVKECQKQIDQLVYKLYGLTKKEREIVEKKTK